jgi:hypothetical protein
MLQRGRGEQTIKYKAEVLKVFPDAKWKSIFISGQATGLNRSFGAISNGDARVSEVYRVAWKAWEDAYWKIKNKQNG